MAKPRLVYISNATEAGTVYTKAELQSLSDICKANNLLLLLDGARLGVALGGYGRADDSASTDGEANSVFIQMFDPGAFGSLSDFKKQANKIKAMCENSETRPGDDSVRVPGQRAWQRRLDQLANGVELYPTIMVDLKPWAEKLGVELPEKM
jgi:L-lactate dehydrogenase